MSCLHLGKSGAYFGVYFVQQIGAIRISVEAFYKGFQNRNQFVVRVDGANDLLRVRLSAREGVAAAVREEGECRTLWQFVQGLTAYARGFDFIYARTELETRAGKLLDIAAATAA